MKPRDALFLGWCAVFCVSLTAVQTRYEVSVNLSESVPDLLYLIQKGVPPKPGDFVVLDQPGYPDVPPSRWVKILAGQEGSEITHWNGRVQVDGHDYGLVLDQTSRGRQLVPGPVGVVPTGHIFVVGTHDRSYDSRYAEVGFIPVQRVIGRAVPLL